MNILIRADSSSTIGTGHIMRDLVLAEQFDDADITFAVLDLEGNINDKIIEAGYDISVLESINVEELDLLIKKLDIDLLVIDHYDMNYKEEKQLKIKNSTLKILSLDDTYEKHYCDILLNHNIYADTAKYKDLVPEGCELRCGGEFTLLREEFKRIKNSTKKSNSVIKNIFVAMGGSDIANLNPKIIEALEDFTNIHVKVVTTKANNNLKELQAYIKNKPWVSLHINATHIAELMAKSHLAIVTPSVTMNEVWFMKIPFIAIKVADNQNEMYHYLENIDHEKVLASFAKDKLQSLIKKSLHV